MLYNIDFETTSLCFLLIIYIVYLVQYSRKTDINRRFQILIIAAAMMIFTDVVTAVTISYYYMVPNWLNQFLNGLNFTAMAYAANRFCEYILTLIYKDKKEPLYNRIFFGVYFALEIINLWTGMFFCFTPEEGYCHGPFYLLQHVICYYYVVYSFIVIVKNRKKIERRQMIASASYSVIMVILGMVQVFLVPDMLLSGLGAALAVMIIFLSLETPDYVKLMDTMAQLKEAKDQAESAREQAEILREQAENAKEQAELARAQAEDAREMGEMTIEYAEKERIKAEEARQQAELAKIQAEEANRAKSRFLANMSHEIRTPINSIMGMDEMICRESTEPPIREYAENVKSASTALLSLVNDILDFSKIESGMIEIVDSDYDLGEALRSVNVLLEEKAGKKGLAFDIKADTALPSKLHSDEGRIKQIMINLLNNAIKYTEKGSVQMEVGWKQLDEEYIELIFSVRDTGIGIKEEDMPKLFREFERLDLERNRTIEGTGLGLAITAKLVNCLEGTIKVDSKYGEGSVFTVRFPQKVVDKTPIGDLHKKYNEKIKKEYHESFTAPDVKILAVDDNKVNLIVLVNLLKKTQVNVDKAGGGQECLDKLAENEYDLVLLDHMMPEMDGIETLARARKLEETTHRYPVYIALTANAIAGAKEEYIEAGFDDYLSKPIKPEDLEEILIKYLPEDKVFLAEGQE